MTRPLQALQANARQFDYLSDARFSPSSSRKSGLKNGEKSGDFCTVTSLKNIAKSTY
jgi:hypothetical protein